MVASVRRAPPKTVQWSVAVSVEHGSAHIHIQGISKPFETAGIVVGPEDALLLAAAISDAAKRWVP